MCKNTFTFFLIPILLVITGARNFTYSPSFDARILSTGFHTPDGTPWNNSNLYPISMGDVNGDGYPDIVGFGMTGVYVSLNSGFSFSTPSLWSALFGINTGWTSFDAYPRYARDINGDGLADLVGFGSSTVTVILSNSTHFVTSTTWSNSFVFNTGWISFNTRPKYLADVNGDGRPDIVGFSNNGVFVSLNTGSAFAASTQWFAEFVSNVGWNTFQARPRFLADVNGDGREDIIGINGSVYVAYSTGTAFVNFTRLNSQFYQANPWINQSETPVYVADINGDKIPDLVHHNNLGLFGETITNQELNNFVGLFNLTKDELGEFLTKNSSTIILTDIDNDKKADIIAFSKLSQGVRVFLNGKTGSSSATVRVCKLCSPSNASCTACPMLPIYFINGTSSCAPGTETTPTIRWCTTMPPNITISLDSGNPEFCNSLLINATLRTSEMEYYKSFLPMVWSGTSNSSNATLLAAFRNYIHSRDNNSTQISIPYSLIQPGVRYTITVSYLNALRVNITNTTTFGPFTHLFPDFHSAPSTIISNYQRHLDTIFQVDFRQTLCINPLMGINTTWNQTGGPQNNSQYSANGYSINIPSCSFLQNTTYIFTIRAFLKQSPNFVTSKSFRFDTQFDSFITQIVNPNRSHIYSSALLLETKTTFFGACPDMNTSLMHYRWTCTIDIFGDGYYSNCDDTENIFGKLNNRSSITVPTNYFRYGSRIEIVVIALKQGKRSVSTSYFVITGPDTLSIELDCVLGPCAYYNSKEDAYFKAIVRNDPDVGYKTQWGYLPISTVFSASRQLFLNIDSTEMSTFQISFQISESYTGFANYTLHINNPPTGGTVLVSPSIGDGLYTKFAIIATNFTDIDLPINYQYFYLNQGKEIPLSHVMYLGTFSSDLPGFIASPSGHVIVKASDFYGASVKRNASVTLRVIGSDLLSQFTYIDRLLQRLPDDLLESMNQAYLIALQMKGILDPLRELRKYLLWCNGCSGSSQVCLLGQCLCKIPDQPSKDCSITSDEFDLKTKIDNDLLVLISSVYFYFVSLKEFQNVAYVSYWDDLVIGSISAISSNVEFTIEPNYIKIDRIIENNLGALKLTKSLTCNQIGELASVYDNIISFFSRTDCECSSFYCLEYPEKISRFIEKFKQVTLNNTIPGQTRELNGIYDSETQEGLNADFMPLLKMPTGISCPRGCTVQGDESCLCPAAMFNITNKLLEIFNGSVFNFDPPKWNWTWDDSYITWVAAGCLGWFVITFLSVTLIKSVRKSCILSDGIQRQSLVLTSILKMYVISNDILSIYFVKKLSTPKFYRAGLYYVRILSYSILAVVFSSPDTTDDFVWLGFNFPIYYYFIPYGVKFAFIGVIHNLIRLIFERKNAIVKREKQINWIFSLFILAAIFGAYYYFVTLIRSKAEDFSIHWLTLFTVFMIQELAIVPILYMLYQLILVGQVTKAQKNRKCVNLLNVFADRQIIELYNASFGRSLMQVYPSTINVISTDGPTTESRNRLNSPKNCTNEIERSKTLYAKEFTAFGGSLNDTEKKTIQLERKNLNEDPLFDLSKEPESPELEQRRLRKQRTITHMQRKRSLFKMGSGELGSTQAILESNNKIDGKDDE